MNMGIVQEIMDIIANGYGSVPTGLDRAIATEVVDYFYRKGWMNPEELAYLVEAAGGVIEIDDKALLNSPPILLRTSKINPDGSVTYVFRTTRKPDVSKAKVNPDAESRTVDSGQINATATRS